MLLGSGGGFLAGGGGLLDSVPTAGVATLVTVPAGAIVGATAGAVVGRLTGQTITNALFSKSEGAFRGDKQNTRDPDHARLMKEFKPDRRQQTRLHEQIGKQKKSSDLDYDELRQIFVDVVGRRP